MQGGRTKAQREASKLEADGIVTAGKNRKALRWSVEAICLEFGIHKNTFLKQARSSGIDPGEDERYNTAQVASIIYGNYHTERSRKMREEADKIERENQISKGELVKVDAVIDYVYEICSSLRNKIDGSPEIPQDVKTKLIAEFKEMFDSGHITRNLKL